MSRNGIAYLSFTEKGRALAASLSRALGGEVSCTRDGVSLRSWTTARFSEKAALVFVGAAGIAVRAVAPHLVSKATDPAVLTVDECGQFVIPLVSGHLGGANALAREIARVTGATACITTATDANGLFAFDDWARAQGMAVLDVRRIKAVSAKLLAGGTVTVCSAFPIAGDIPAGVALAESVAPDVWVDVHGHEALTLVPPALVLGVGCRRGITQETLEKRFTAFCAENAILPQAISCAATIDLKCEEAGLLDFCAGHGWPLSFYSAAELRALEGDFSVSPFVEETTGVGNVCERAACLRAGGKLAVQKSAGDGVTFALARGEISLDWSVEHGDTVCGGHRPGI